MHFRVLLADIRELVAKASVTTSSKDAMAVLKNFHLEVGDREFEEVGEGGEVIFHREKSLFITGTDLELSYRGSIPCVGKDGVVLVDARKFAYILSRADGEDVTVAKIGNKIDIVAGAAKHALVVLSPNEYPEIKFYDVANAEITPFEIQREPFLENLRKVSHAICADEIRANLMAVSLKNSQMIAADGRRLAIARVSGDVTYNVDIPAPSVKSLTKLLGLLSPNKFISNGDALVVQCLEENVHFKFGEREQFSIRASTSGFPNVQKQVEKTDKNNIEVMLDAEHLTRILKRVSINCDDETNSVKIELTPTEIVFTTQDEVGNRSVEKVPNESKYSFVSYFNLGYLVESLSVLDRKSVLLRFAQADAGRAMPLRIDEDAYTEIILAEHGDF